MSEQSRKEDYTPYLIELMKSSEMGDFKKVKTLLIRRKYTIEAVDVSIRKCIFKYFRTKPEYIKTIAELIRHSDLNFQNPTFDNTNPIMLASAKGDPFLIKEIIEQTDLPKKIEIDLTKKDKNDMNFIHYILTRNTNEEEAIEIGEIAANIGIGFQIIDDVINLTSGNKGKKRGDDIVEGKKSLPVLLHIQDKPEDKAQFSAYMAQAAKEGIDSPAVEKCIALLETSGCIQKACQQGKKLIEENCKLLEDSPLIFELFNSMIPEAFK